MVGAVVAVHGPDHETVRRLRPIASPDEAPGGRSSSSAQRPSRGPALLTVSAPAACGRVVGCA